MSVVDGLPFTQEKKAYIIDVLDPILEEMVADVIAEMPADPLDHMIAWIRKRNGVGKMQRMSVLQTNVHLKKELNHIVTSTEEACLSIAQDLKDQPDEKDDDEEEEDDECDEIPESFMKPESQMGKSRASVSAEAYGGWNVKKEFVAPIIDKSNEQKQRLSSTLRKSFMFSNLEDKDMEVVIMAMKEVDFEKDKKVIEEGESGDYLFVIETGSLDCTKSIDGEEKVVRSVNPGDVFGELALLYNCPRAATVIAKEACICWQLDRDTFSNIVKDAATRRREKYDTFLKQVSILNSLGAYERSQVADAIIVETFSKGAFVVKQDEPGDKFYIVEDGELHATKKDSGKQMEYKTGDYFGELALLKNQPRAASVIVDSDQVKVLSISRSAFKHMLRPLQDLLLEQTQRYK